MKTPKRKNISPADRVLGFNSTFAMTESYKSIRTNIMYSMPKTNSGKVLVITSATPDDGKTTTCTNLALTFAQTGAKVLLIDCDLRKPRIHRHLCLERKDGISNVLCGFAELDKAIKRNVRDNLDVLTSGETPPNPVELLGSAEFEEMINTLKEKYDYIFIDTPPINIVTDATLAIKQSTGTVFIVKQNHTTYDMLEEALDKLNKVNTNIIGTIFISAKDSHQKYKRSYVKRYLKKYSYKYSEK
ncbi:MAG: CpsD/CapB family tyrosine-protein kinase [Clostridia bacterium]|nr:CpsD/CapB family tyrosine-protein kinase [Clostridia bacterium]